MAARTLILALGLLPRLAVAQTPYVVERSSAAFAPLAAPTVLTGSSADDEEWSITLPFPFAFFNAEITALTIGANGAILFPGGRSVSFSNRAPGSSSFNSGFVAPFWDDLRLFASNGGRIAWSVEGTAPRRQVAIEWLEISRFSDATGAVSFQVRLSEGPSGRIDLDYGPARPGARAFDATIGIESLNGEGLEASRTRCSPRCTLTEWPGADRRITLRLDPGPELLTGEPPSVPGILIAGRTSTAAVQVVNAHGRTLGPFAVTLELARSSDFSDAFEVGRARIQLTAYEQRTLVLDLAPPATTDAASYFARLLVDADGEVTEVNETNNRETAADLVAVLPAGPGLFAESLSLDRARAVAGSTLSVTWSILNDGPIDIAAVEATVVLSANPVITQRDIRLAMVEAVPLGSGARDRRGTIVTLPSGLSPGRWHLGLVVDPEDRVRETDETNNAAVSRPVVVEGTTLSILTPAALPIGYEGLAYRVQLEASAPETIWRLTSGALAPGLRLETGGLIVGQLTDVGTARFELRAERGAQVVRRAFSLEVLAADAPLALPIRSLPTGAVGRPYAFEVPVVGSAVNRSGGVAFDSEGLPSGVQLDGRLLHGRPNEAGNFTVRLSARIGDETAQASVPLRVRLGGRLRIRAEIIDPLSAGRNVRISLRADGGVDPLNWSALGLPPGLVLSAEGEITGRPEGSGRFDVAARVVDAEGAQDQEVYVLRVEPMTDGPAPAFDPILPDAVLGAAYRAVLDAPAEASITLVEGAWPPGVTGRSIDGAYLIEGVPSVPGRYDVWLAATDRSGRSTEVVRTLRVRRGAPELNDVSGCRTQGTRPLDDGALLATIALFSGAAANLRRRRRCAVGHDGER